MTNTALMIDGLAYTKIEQDPRERRLYLASKGKFTTQAKLDLDAVASTRYRPSILSKYQDLYEAAKNCQPMISMADYESVINKINARADIVSTGDAAIDTTVGGFPLGTLTLIVGRHGSGRSTVAMELAHKFSGRDNTDLIIASAERSEHDIVRDIFDRTTDVKSNVVVLQQLQGGTTLISSLRDKLENTNVKVVIIDGLDLLGIIGPMIQEVRSLAREFNVAIVGTKHAVSADMIPIMVMHTADKILAVNKSEEFYGGVIEIKVLKSRDSKSGVTCYFNLDSKAFTPF